MLWSYNLTHFGLKSRDLSLEVANLSHPSTYLILPSTHYLLLEKVKHFGLTAKFEPVTASSSTTIEESIAIAKTIASKIANNLQEIPVEKVLSSVDFPQI